MRGLIMGRYQPFHLGHMALAEQAMAECDDIIIAVTSAQYNYLEKDPFTAGERIEMVRNAMSESGADPGRYMILGLENQHNVATWPSYLKVALPPFQRVYSGNPYVAMLLGDQGIEVAQPKMLDRERFNATALRLMMAHGGDWRSRVPPAVARFIESVSGEDRIRTILDSDTDPTSH